MIVSLDYVVVGGSSRFMDALFDAWPPEIEEVDEVSTIIPARDQALSVAQFYRWLSDSATHAPERLVELLEHVYGSSRATCLLAEGGFSSSDAGDE